MPAGVARSGFRFNDRALFLGRSGSGKSELLNFIASQINCQKLLWDSKDEFTIPGVTPVYKPEQIRWDEPVIHLVDDSCDTADVEKMFDVCWRRKTGRAVVKGPQYGLVVVVHEAGDICNDNPNRTPRAAVNYIKKGRAHGLGLYAGSQRPRNMPTSARTEVQQVVTFAGGLDPDDLPTAAKMHRMSVPDFEAALNQARELGEHAYIWTDLRTSTTVIRPPLPEHLRKQSLARGLEPRTTEKPIASQDADEGGAPEPTRDAPSR